MDLVGEHEHSVHSKDQFEPQWAWSVWELHQKPIARTLSFGGHIARKSHSQKPQLQKIPEATMESKCFIRLGWVGKHTETRIL